MTQASLRTYSVIVFFKVMIDDRAILNYTTSIEMVIKELRDEKDVSQSRVNIEFEQEYGFSINLGRMESNSNFKMIKLLYICDYFDMSVFDFFKRVANIKEDEIMKFLKEKKARKQKRKSINKNK
ncbi:MAG: hypothetical protein V3U92_11020 [Cellulophaga sp.]